MTLPDRPSRPRRSRSAPPRSANPGGGADPVLGTSQDSDEAAILRLLDAASKLRPTIESAFLDNAILSQPHLRLSSRVKTLYRAYHKLTRIRSEKPATAYDLEDLLGFRFVTLFNTNISETLEAVVDLIRDEAHTVFDCGDCRALIYTSRPQTDPLSIENAVKHLFDREGKGIKSNVHSVGTLYSSIHVIAKCPVSLQTLDGKVKTHLLPVELQFRTAMEDLWSQVSHVTRYSRRESTQLNPIGDHLNALKQLIDGCALYAGLIQLDANRSLVTSREVNERPMSARSLSWGELRDVPADIIEAYDAAIDRQTLATSVRDQAEATVSGNMFADAAAAFAGVEIKIRRQITGPAMDEALYKVQMERAFCLLYSENVQALDEAFTIYETLAREHAEDSIVRLRLGQTQKRRNDVDASKASLEEAKTLLENGKDPRVRDRNRLFRSIYMELGAVYYDLSTTATDEDSKHDLVGQALGASRSWLDFAEPNDHADVLGAINNILYFSWEQLRQFGEASMSRDELVALLLRLDTEKIATFVAKPKHDAIYDTICRLYGHLGDRGKEAEAAGKTIAAVHDKIERRAGRSAEALSWPEIEKQLTADEMDTYQHALRVVSRTFGKPV